MVVQTYNPNSQEVEEARLAQSHPLPFKEFEDNLDCITLAIPSRNTMRRELMRGPCALYILLFILACATLIASSKAADAKGKSEFSLKILAPSIQWGISEVRFVDLLWILQYVNMGYQQIAGRCQGGWFPFSLHHHSSHPANRKLNKTVCVQGLDHRAPWFSMYYHTPLDTQQRISHYKSWNFAPCPNAFVKVTRISSPLKDAWVFWWPCRPCTFKGCCQGLDLSRSFHRLLIALLSQCLSSQDFLRTIKPWIRVLSFPLSFKI